MVRTNTYRKKRAATRKVYRRGAYKKRAKAYVKRQLGASNKLVGFPSNKICKFRYCEIITLDPATAVPSVHYFSANGLHDPNITGTGHQPLGWDQWKAFYNHYAVLGAKCTVRVCPNNSSASVPAACVSLFLNDDTTLDVTDPFVRMEKGMGRNVLFNPNQGMDKAITLKSFFSAKKFFNVKDVKDNITRIGSAIGANPTEQAYFTIVYGPADNSSTTTPACQFAVTIDYIVAMSEPQDLVTS